MDIDPESLTFRDRVIAYCCNVLPLVVVMFALSVVGLLITLYSLAVLESGSGAVVVATINVPGLIGLIVGTGYVLYNCRQRAAERDVSIDELTD